MNTTILPPLLPNNKGSRFAKWISFELLLHPEEMKDLLESFSGTLAFSLRKTAPLAEQRISFSSLLQDYKKYVLYLMNGEIPPVEFLQNGNLYPVFTEDPMTLSYYPYKESGNIKMQKPSMPAKPVCLHFSPRDLSVRPVARNPEDILWGLQFSFPYLYQDSQTKKIETFRPSSYPNHSLPKRMRSFIRERTVPTTFLYQSQKLTSSFRLGKKYLPYISKHPQLKRYSLSVHDSIS